MKSGKAFSAYVASAALLAPSAVLAGEEVDESKPAEHEGTVRIENVRGEIDIIGWDKPEIRVEGELDDLAQGLQFRVSGDETLIRIEMPDSNVNWGDGSDLEIHVPTRSRLNIDGVSTDIELNRVTGALMIRSVSGDVEASDVGDGVQINTVSGDVELSGGNGRIQVVTVSGELTLAVQATDISVSTVSGEITLELGNFDALGASTVNGEVSIGGRLNQSGHLRVTSVNGDLVLTLEEPVNARIEARTGPGGEIENALTDDEPRDIFPNQMKLESRSGDGSGLIELTTVNGEIRLERG